MTKPQLVASDYESQAVNQNERGLGSKTFQDAGSLSGSGGDDGMNDLRIRVSALEVHTEYIRSDIREMKPTLQDVRSRLDRLEIKIDHLPSKGYINTAVAGAITLIGAIIVLQGHIQHLLGFLPTLPK